MTIDNPLEVTIAGRVMLLLTRLGMRDARCLRIYQGATICAFRRLRREQPTADADELVQSQLDLLGRALIDARSRGAASQTAPVDALPAAADVAAAAEAGTEADSPPRANRAPSGYVPVAKSMEEKLHDERLPVQQLVREDCVRAGLIDADTAQRLIAGMSGKTSEQSELEIVEHLRQRLQDQVRAFIRKARGGPWSDPRTQEDLRQDIHRARSVRGVLTLSRQVLKEYQTWEMENGRRGILGLFSARRRPAQGRR